eukprot:1148059-Pelagomonas_calceolata.AAC.3
MAVITKPTTAITAIRNMNNQGGGVSLIIRVRQTFLGPLGLSGRNLLMQISFCAFGQSTSKVCGKVPPCACGSERNKEHCPLRCGNGVNRLPSWDLGMLKHQMSVSCAFRGLGDELGFFCTR